MLDLLRKKAQSPFIQGTVLIIVLVFVFWGVGSSYRGTLNSVATVNKVPITYEEFQQTYERVINQYRDQFGGTLPKGLIESLGLENQVIDQLIQRELLRQGAAELGILVSDLEIRQAVEKMEAFRTNGIFDVQQYKSLISGSGMTPSIFEGNMRSDLVTGKVVEHLSRFAKVTPMEINNSFSYENEEVKLEYVALSGTDFKDKVTVDEDELAAYFEEHKENYMTEPQVKLHFLAFPYDADEKPEITAAELEAFYRQNINRFSIPEQRSARHILFKTSEEDAEEALSEKFQLAEEVLELARSDESFAELAMQYSEGPTGPKGGDLGKFTRGRMVKPFDDAVFSLEEGQISDVVETQFGFHIIKLEKIEPAHIKTLNEVKGSIEAGLQKQRSNDLAFNNATEAYEKIILAGSLGKYSDTVKADVIKTDFFPRNSPADSGLQEGFINEPAFLEGAFALNKGELSSLVETPKGYVIIFAADKKAPEVAPLEKVRTQLEKDYRGQKAESIAAEAAENLLATLREQHGKGTDDLAAETAKLDISVKDSGYINRSGKSASDENAQPLPEQVVSNGFSLTAENPYPEEIAMSNNTFYVSRFIDRRPPSPDLLVKEEGEIKKGLLEQKKAQILVAWIANERSKAAIEINELYQ
jgi:peptidyl-prolyl cis-trans isomerase D